MLGGFLFLDHGAATDNTDQRRSTFVNANQRLRLFDGRNDPAGRDEQYERLYVVLLDANPFKPAWTVHRVGKSLSASTLEAAFVDLIDLVAERNPDFYDSIDGELKHVRS